MATLLVAAACGGDDAERPAERDGVQASEAEQPEDTQAREPQDQGRGPDDPAPVPRAFVSRPDIPEPPIDVTVSQSTAPGLLFLTHKERRVPRSALIVDKEGEVVFSSPHRVTVTDFRVQRYRGEPVLTWWQGRVIDGRGDGEYIIVDSSYEEVARVAAGNGLNGDLHEFQLTDEDTALILAYDPQRADLTEFGGPPNGFMYEYYVQEVDIETGEVLFQWRATDHVSPSETFSEFPSDLDGDGSAESPFDWFHVNSAAEDGDDTLLVSARNTDAVYAIDRQSGEVRWRLGGKQSDFEMGDGTAFSLQHDARRHPDGTISIFDNIDPETDESRALFLDVDEATGTATLVREVRHADGIRADTQGNAQLLPTGGVVVSWGSEGRISEFSPEDELVFDAAIAPARAYRAYRFEWEGQPKAPPDVAVRSDGDDGLDLYVSWNGATEVADWRVVAGDSPDNLVPVATAAKDGFETRIEIDAVDYLAVEALDTSGDTLARSPTQPVPDQVGAVPRRPR